MVNEVLKFSVDKIDFVQELSDSQNAVAKIKVCHDGMNSHERPISLETIKNAAPSLKNKWLVAGWSGFDFKGHEGKEQRIIGSFPSDDFEYVEEDGKTYLVALCLISKLYATWAFEIFEQDNFRECSMEIMVLDSQVKDDGYDWIENFIFSAVTVLGKGTHAACPGSAVEIVKFSDDELIQIRDRVYQECFGKYDGLDFSIPKKVQENAKKGLELRREYGRGGTAVGISTARSLSNGGKASPELVKKIHKFFPRHLSNIKKSLKTKGDVENSEIANYLWGGLEGMRWADSLWNSMNKQDEQQDKQNMSIGFEELEGSENKTGFSEDEFESKEGEKMEKEKENMQEEEVKKEDMASENTESTEQMADEGTEKEDKAQDDEKDEKGEEEEMSVNYQQMYEEMCGKYSEMETKYSEMEAKMNTYMSENEELKKFRADIESKEMMQKVECTLSEVMEVMSKEKIDEMREDSKNFSLETIAQWENKVKAEAFSATKGKAKTEGFSRIALPFTESSSEYKSKSIWDRI